VSMLGPTNKAPTTFSPFIFQKKNVTLGSAARFLNKAHPQ